jgi:hypothetical protein
VNKPNQTSMNAKEDPRLNGASSKIAKDEETGVDTFVFSSQPPTLPPEKAMAGSILRLAAHDLRRFRGASGGVGRQLYLDAYDWIRANDYSWPVSFVNVCQSLNLDPEVVRRTVLEDASLGLFGYCARRCGRAARELQIFLHRVLTKNRRSIAVDPVPLTHAF